MRVDSHTQDWQAMRVLIHTHIPCRLLVEGNAPKPLLNAEFHSAAGRSSNAFLKLSFSISWTGSEGESHNEILSGILLAERKPLLLFPSSFCAHGTATTVISTFDLCFPFMPVFTYPPYFFMTIGTYLVWSKILISFIVPFLCKAGIQSSQIIYAINYFLACTNWAFPTTNTIRYRRLISMSFGASPPYFSTRPLCYIIWPQISIQFIIPLSR